MTAVSVLILIVALLAIGYLLNIAADRLNLRHMSEAPPPEVEDVFETDEYSKSQRYLHATTRFGTLRSTVFTILTIVFLVVRGPGLVDSLIRSWTDNPIVAGLLFFSLIAVAFWFLGLPFRCYSTFMIERDFGFNRTTPATFVQDLIKEALITAVIGGPILALILWIFTTTGPRAALYAWVAMTVVQFIMSVVAPPLILPMFNRFTPIPDGELKDSIESYAHAQNFALSGVFIMDGSRRSGKSNAFFTGLGPWRRIVLYDTLVENHSTDEIVAILAHETGHFKLRHIPLQMAFQLLSSFLMFVLLGLCLFYEPIYGAVGMTLDPIGGHVPIHGGMFVFGYLYTPVSTLFQILGNRLSRRHEYEADAFAARTSQNTAAMIDALKKLAKDNLSNLSPHPFYVFLNYSHPPMAERIRALRTAKAV